MAVAVGAMVPRWPLWPLWCRRPPSVKVLLSAWVRRVTAGVLRYKWGGVRGRVIVYASRAGTYLPLSLSAAIEYVSYASGSGLRASSVRGGCAGGVPAKYLSVSARVGRVGDWTVVTVAELARALTERAKGRAERVGGWGGERVMFTCAGSSS